MPQVPVYEQNVEARPLMRQGITTQASAEAFGASAGRGMQALGAGISDLGQAVAQVQAMKDKAVADETRNNYMRERDALMYDPENGFMNSQGRNAIDGRESFTQKMRGLREKYAKGLSGSQSEIFNRSVEPLEMDAERSAMQHSAGQLKSYIVEQGQASAEMFGQEAVRTYRDKAMSDGHLQAGIAELREIGRKQGLPPEAIEQRERQFISSTSVAIVKNLALTDPIAADDYMKANADRFTETDRTALTSALDESVYAARGQQDAQNILGGVPVDQDPVSSAQPEEGNPVANLDPPGDMISDVMRAGTPKARANNVVEVAASMIGLNEKTSRVVLSQFIRATTGISIDPRVTPWCAAFANAVLGAAGIEGTGKLNARSFLNFGTATDNPQVGDIVVLARGSDPSKGHVGFFQGYDANGNILVLGGNQGNSVKVSSYSKENVLGFRAAGAVTDQTIGLPNYSPAGLAHIQEQLDQIKDPRRRAAAQKAINDSMAAQKKAMDQQRDQASEMVYQQLLTNPTMDLTKLPVDVQQSVGMSGMKSLMEYQDKVRTAGEPTTDYSVLYDVQMLKPEQLARMTKDQLFQYRPHLDNGEFESLLKRKQEADTGIGETQKKMPSFNEIEAISKPALQAAGINTTLANGDSAGKAEVEARIAKFNSSVYREAMRFKDENGGRNPNEMELMEIVNRQLLPVVFRDVNNTTWGDGDIEGKFAFEAPTMPDGFKMEFSVSYDQIPADKRMAITEMLRERAPNREVTKTDVEQFYNKVLADKITREDTYRAGRDLAVRGMPEDQRYSYTLEDQRNGADATVQGLSSVVDIFRMLGL